MTMRKRISYFAMPGLINDVNFAIQVFKADRETVYSKSRKKEAVEARYAVMYLRHKIQRQSTTKAAGEFGLDHCACLHAIKKVGEFLDTDPQFKNRFKTFLNQFSNE